MHKAKQSNSQEQSYVQQKIKKIELNYETKELIDDKDDVKILGESGFSNFYKLISLEFGGFLLFEPEKIVYYKNQLKNGRVCTKLLRTQQKVNCICCIDQELAQMNSQELQNIEPKMIRYLIGTEEGELYMIGFQTDKIIVPNVVKGSCSQDQNQFMIVEFLASALPDCSGLIYLNDGLIYYTSKFGENLLIQLLTEHSGIKDQPYISIVQRFPTFGCINDLLIKENDSIKIHNQQKRKNKIQVGQQQEILIAGGQGCGSKISVIKKGISINTVSKRIKGIPEVESGQNKGIFVFQDKLILKFQGVQVPIIFKLSLDESDSTHIAITENEVQIHNQFKDPLEFIIALKEIMIQEIMYVLIATKYKLLIYDSNFEMVQSQFDVETQNPIIHLIAQRDKIVVSQENGVISYFDLSIIEQHNFQKLEAFSTFETQRINVSAIALSETDDIIYITLTDAPNYSIIALNPLNQPFMQIICTQSLSYCLNNIAYRKQKINNELKSLLTFNKFKGDKNNNSQQIQGSNDIQIEIEMEQADLNKIEPFAVESKFKSLNSSYDVPLVISMEVLSIKNQDFILCGMSNGQVLQICLDIQIFKVIKQHPNAFQHQVFKDSDMRYDQREAFPQDNNELPQALWNAKLFNISDSAVDLAKINKNANQQKETAVFACSSKPAIFYRHRNEIVMKYINSRVISQIKQTTISNNHHLFYESEKGVVSIGQLEEVSNFQMKQFEMKKQVLKLLQIPNTDLIVALMESPNYGYLNSKNYDNNSVSIYDTSNNFELVSAFHFDNCELPASMILINKKLSSQQNGIDNLLSKSRTSLLNQRNMECSVQIQKPFILVGTMILSDSEDIPSQGRFLILGLNSANKLKLTFKEHINGSVEAIECLGNNYDQLLLCVNGDLSIYSLNYNQTGDQFMMKLYETKSYGIYTSDLKVFNQTAFWSDSFKGMILYDIKDTYNKNSTQIKNLQLKEGPHYNQGICSIKEGLIPLNENEALIFDNEQNVWIFKRFKLPINDEQKLKLNLMGGIRIGERVKKGIRGEFHQKQGDTIFKVEEIGEDELDLDPYNINVNRFKKHVEQSEVTEKQQQFNQQELDQALNECKDEEKQMEIDNFNDNQNQFTKKGGKYNTKEFLNKALDDLVQYKCREQNILFGTENGSLGALISIPESTYIFLDMLQQHMEKDQSMWDNTKRSRKQYRTMKVECSYQVKHQRKNFIDGDFIEFFLELQQRKQQNYINAILSNERKGKSEMVEQVKSLIEILKEKH